VSLLLLSNYVHGAELLVLVAPIPERDTLFLSKPRWPIPPQPAQGGTALDFDAFGIGDNWFKKAEQAAPAVFVDSTMDVSAFF
jgi:hypothetical protein